MGTKNSSHSQLDFERPCGLTLVQCHSNKVFDLVTKWVIVDRASKDSVWLQTFFEVSLFNLENLMFVPQYHSPTA